VENLVHYSTNLALRPQHNNINEILNSKGPAT